MGFDHCEYEGEEDYIQEFIALYGDGLTTPEGWSVKFSLHRRAIVHTWRGGKGGPFRKGRAVKIRWIGEVISNAESRCVKYDPSNESVHFLSEKIGKNSYYCVVCKKTKDNKLLFTTAFPIDAKRRENKIKILDDFKM